MARKEKNRPLNITYLILVEGSTELIYFQNLKEAHGHFGFTIKLKKAKHGNPATLIEEALKESEKGVYSQIWCVYDCDVLVKNKNETFDGVYRRAQKKGIQFAESMPCIEVWFVLHFEKPKNSYQDGDAVVTDLKKHIPDYRKNQNWQERNLYSSLKEHSTQALTNVLKLPLIAHYCENTATSVNVLVQIFDEG
ncbi:MAG: RloB family protein [Tannerella sp.]|nr:RloB family protein [Tannerella sp.]